MYNILLFFLIQCYVVIIISIISKMNYVWVHVINCKSINVNYKMYNEKIYETHVNSIKFNYLNVH